jgi:hypothetical protein
MKSKIKNTPLPLLDLSECLLSEDQGLLLDKFERELPDKLEKERTLHAAMEAAALAQKEAEANYDAARSGEIEPEEGRALTEEYVGHMVQKAETRLIFAKGKARQATASFIHCRNEVSDFIRQFLRQVDAENLPFVLEQRALGDVDTLLRNHLVRVPEDMVREIFFVTKKRGYLVSLKFALDALNRLNPFERGQKVEGPIRHAIALLRQSPAEFAASRGGKW